MARTYRASAGQRFGNAVIGALIAAGIAPKNYAILTAPGCRTGQPRSTPVRPVELGGQRYVVSPYGTVNWVRNVHAAGSATLARGRRTETVQLVECDAGESGRVLREYIRVAPIVRPYFDATKDDPVERFEAEADRHPVFRVG